MTTNLGKRALDACIELVRLKGEIKALTAAISDALSQCPGVNGSLLPLDDNASMGAVMEWSRKVKDDSTHVKEAYSPDIGDHGKGVWMSEKEIRDYLSEQCPHCLAAHEAIQKRREARKQLGIVSRKLTAAGRAATRAASKKMQAA